MALNGEDARATAEMALRLRRVIQDGKLPTNSLQQSTLPNYKDQADFTDVQNSRLLLLPRRN